MIASTSFMLPLYGGAHLKSTMPSTYANFGSTGPSRDQLLALSARQNQSSSPAQPVYSPSRRLVAPLARALGAPSHLGLLAALLSFVAEPTSFAAESAAQAQSARRQFLASIPPPSRDMDTDRHHKLSHPAMVDPRTPQPRLSRLPKCVDSTLHPFRPLDDGHIRV